MEIEEMDYLNPFQSGIRSGHGADMTLIVLMDYFHWDFDMGSTSLLVLLDISVAFDTINHGNWKHGFTMILLLSEWMAPLCGYAREVG